MPSARKTPSAARTWTWGWKFARIAEGLHELDEEALQAPDVQKRFSDQGFEAGGSTAEVLGKLLESEFEKYGRVIKESGMKIE